MGIEKYTIEFPELFEIKLEFTLGGVNYDLHNEFVCERIKLLHSEFQLVFRGEKDVLSIHFKDAEIKEIDIPLDREFEYVLDNFQRGRFELEGVLHEVINGKTCYYLEFYEKGRIEIVCSKIEVTHIAI